MITLREHVLVAAYPGAEYAMDSRKLYVESFDELMKEEIIKRYSEKENFKRFSVLIPSGWFLYKNENERAPYGVSDPCLVAEFPNFYEIIGSLSELENNNKIFDLPRLGEIDEDKDEFFKEFEKNFRLHLYEIAIKKDFNLSKSFLNDFNQSFNQRFNSYGLEKELKEKFLRLFSDDFLFIACIVAKTGDIFEAKDCLDKKTGEYFPRRAEWLFDHFFGMVFAPSGNRGSFDILSY